MRPEHVQGRGAHRPGRQQASREISRQAGRLAGWQTAQQSWQCTRAGNEMLTHACAVRRLREELTLLQEPGSYVGEVVKVMGKNKVLVKVGSPRAYECACK